MPRKKYNPRMNYHRVLPPAGTELRSTYHGGEYHAVIIEDKKFKLGRGVSMDGKFFKTLSGAAKSIAGHPMNGWAFWKF